MISTELNLLRELTRSKWEGWLIGSQWVTTQRSTIKDKRSTINDLPPPPNACFRRLWPSATWGPSVNSQSDPPKPKHDSLIITLLSSTYLNWIDKHVPSWLTFYYNEIIFLLIHITTTWTHFSLFKKLFPTSKGTQPCLGLLEKAFFFFQILMRYI